MTDNNESISTISREKYANLYGPTTGDRVRLADTELFVEIEQDLAGGPEHSGSEAIFGGGKVIRESMGQSVRSRIRGAPDTVITGALVLDHWGVIKADVGLRGGRIAAMGKAGNPETMDGVHPDLVIGPETEVLAGNGKILTAGAIDTHVHMTTPQLADEALASGVTTLIGGGVGMSEGTRATTVTPGSWHLARMFEALESYPVNIGLFGRGSTLGEASMYDQLRAGALGFKVHEDWGATPAALDACLRVCDSTGAQVALHSDSLNESGYAEETIAAINGRTIHAFHVEGAGGGHAPDIIKLVSHDNVLPASTNPTKPHTINTVDEHMDMLMVCHHLNPNVKEDKAFAQSRIRTSTITAEDVLHDLGAISIMSSDAQAMGRIGEVVMRSWQTAHSMKTNKILPDSGSRADNARARRYVAKYTVNPAIAHGIDHEVGSVETGKLADLVLWDPKFFGVKPSVVLKGGAVARAQNGDTNAAIPTPQPVLPRASYGAVGDAPASLSLNFVTELALEERLPERLGLATAFSVAHDTRQITKEDLRENTATPKVDVQPDAQRVTIDGAVETPAPAGELPMAQRYFLF